MNLDLRRAIAVIIGKTPQRRPIPVTLWGKSDCSLCDRAKAILDKLGQEYALVVSTRDILADSEAFERFRYVIPVVEIEGGQRFEGKITEYWLRRGLDAVLLSS